MHLTREPEVPGSIPSPDTYFVSPSAVLRRAVISSRRRYVHLVLGNRLGGISLPMLVGCFEFIGPLRQHFSLYRAVSKEREKDERKDR